MTHRQLSEQDLLVLSRALHAHQVEHAVIGGAAMGLSGFPRQTRDIDLLLPVDAQNTQKLLKALDSAIKDKAALAQGYSTAVEGEITIDLLFRAAGLLFEDVRDYLKQVNVSGTCVTTLNVDGLLLTKQTDRISDAADRYKLEKYRQSEHDLALMMDRIQRLNDLPDKSGMAHVLWSQVNEAIEAAGSVLNAD